MGPSSTPMIAASSNSTPKLPRTQTYPTLPIAPSPKPTPTLTKMHNPRQIPPEPTMGPTPMLAPRLTPPKSTMAPTQKLAPKLTPPKSMMAPTPRQTPPRLTTQLRQPAVRLHPPAPPALQRLLPFFGGILTIVILEALGFAWMRWYQRRKHSRYFDFSSNMGMETTSLSSG